MALTRLQIGHLDLWDSLRISAARPCLTGITQQSNWILSAKHTLKYNPYSAQESSAMMQQMTTKVSSRCLQSASTSLLWLMQNTSLIWITLTKTSSTLNFLQRARAKKNAGLNWVWLPFRFRLSHRHRLGNLHLLKLLAIQVIASSLVEKIGGFWPPVLASSCALYTHSHWLTGTQSRRLMRNLSSSSSQVLLITQFVRRYRISYTKLSRINKAKRWLRTIRVVFQLSRGPWCRSWEIFCMMLHD